MPRIPWPSRMFDRAGRSRRVLGILLVVVLVGLMGCLGALNGDDGETDDAVEFVPAETDALVSMDMAVLTSSEVGDLIDGISAILDDELDDPPADDGIDEFIDEFESESGLAYDELDSLLLFGDQLDEPAVEEEFGIIVQAGWDVHAVAESIADEEMYDLELTDYAGESVLYEPTDEPAFGEAVHIGDLDDGVFVIGDEGSVKAALDVAHADADSLSGPLLEVFEEAPAGGITTAFMMDEEIPDEFDDPVPPGDDELVPPGFDLEVFDEVEAVSSTIYTDGGSFAFDATWIAESTDAATDLEDIFDGAISLWKGVADDEVADELDAVEIERDGATLTMSYQIAVDDLLDHIEDAIAAFAAFTDGFGGAQPGEQTPEVSLAFEWDGGDELLTIDHQAGDAMSVDGFELLNPATEETYCDEAADWAWLSDGEIVAGSSCTTDAGALTPGDTVIAQYHTPDGFVPTVIEVYTIETDDTLALAPATH